MNNIRSLREQLGLSQSAIANVLGITAQAVSKWERGFSDPQWDFAPKLAEVLCCSIDELYGRDPPSQDAGRPSA